jgi:predicted N-acyltransferase
MPVNTLQRRPCSVKRTVEVVHRIADVSPPLWDDLSAGRPFLDHRWLRLTEAVLAAHEPRYVLLREGERLVAGAVCAVDRRFQPPRLQRLAGGLLRRFPVLRCGVPIASESGLLVRPGDGAPDRQAALLAALRGLAAEEHAAFVKLEHLSAAAGAGPGLRRGGYFPLGTWADTAIDVPWPTFDAYLDALPSRKRRDVARIRRRAAAEGIAVVPVEGGLEAEPGTARRLRDLMENVLHRHGAVEAYHPDRLPRARAVLGDDLCLLAVRRHGRIVGCASLLSSGSETAAKWLGLDYEQTWGTAAYLSLLLETIAHAIARGASRLHTGATAYETKRHLGAAIEWRSGAAAFRNPLVNRLAGATTSVVEELHRLAARRGADRRLRPAGRVRPAGQRTRLLRSGR